LRSFPNLVVPFQQPRINYRDRLESSIVCTCGQRENPPAGCSKRPSSKAAAISHLLRGGWDDPNCARPTRAFGGRALREHRNRPSYPAPFFSILLNQIRLRNSTDKGGSVTASEWGMP
jgi:hypothetical protein